MDFDLTIGSTFEHVPTEVHLMISLRKPFQMYNSMFVHDTSYLNLRLRSFPRSSVIAQEYNALNKNWTSLSLHFVTRDMRFIGFNLSGYTDGGSM